MVIWKKVREMDKQIFDFHLHHLPRFFFETTHDINTKGYIYIYVCMYVGRYFYFLFFFVGVGVWALISLNEDILKKHFLFLYSTCGSCTQGRCGIFNPCCPQSGIPWIKGRDWKSYTAIVRDSCRRKSPLKENYKKRKRDCISIKKNKTLRMDLTHQMNGTYI